jgi:hypothetical protein
VSSDLFERRRVDVDSLSGSRERGRDRARRHRYAGHVLFLLVLLTTARAYAFDGSRRGFVLGLGLGPGVTSFKQTLHIDGIGSTRSDWDSELDLTTQARIGVGLTEQILIYYANNVSWFRMRNVLGDDVGIASSIGLIGASIYFGREAPCFYLLGYGGVASWDPAAPVLERLIHGEHDAPPFEFNVEASRGLGAGLGLGRELRRHLSTELSVAWGNPSDANHGVELESDVIWIQLTVHALAF